MARIVDISSRLDNEKPKLKINSKDYEINDSVSTVIKFEELASKGTSKGMLDALELALGKNGFEELKVKEMRFPNLQVLFAGILAAMQDIPLEEAEKRFRKK